MPKWIQAKSCFNSNNSPYPPSTNMLRFYEVDFSGSSTAFSQRSIGATLTNIVTAGLNEGINNGIDANGEISFYVFVACTNPSSPSETDRIYFVAFDSLTFADEVFATIQGNPTSASSVRNIEVVPKHGSPNVYYVIYKTACINTLSPDNINYVTVDMNTKTVSAPITISSGSNNEGMGITKSVCGLNQRWLFFSKLIGGNLNIYRSSIDPSGISIPIFEMGVSLPNVNSYGQGDLEISPDGTKLAIALLSTSNADEDVLLFDLDNNTGTLSNYRWIDNPTNFIFSLEFSPNSERLYLSKSSNTTVVNRLFNVPVLSSNYVINENTDQVTVSFHSGLISMEIGFDQRLYFNKGSNISEMMVIANPNTDALNNIVTQTQALSYGTGHSGNSFPDQIDGDFLQPQEIVSLGVTEDTICQGQSVTLSANGATSYSWSGGLAGSNSSHLVNPMTTTTYYVSSSDSCANQTDSITIVVFPIPVAQIIGDHEICEGESITLLGTGGLNYFWNGSTSFGQNSIYLSPSATTTYSLIVSNVFCSSPDVNFTVTVHPKPEIELEGDSIFCAGETAFFTSNLNSGTPPYTYTWSDGSANSTNTFIPFIDQDLSVIVIDQFNCSDTASVHIEVEPQPQANFELDEEGCSPLWVSAQNESSNATIFMWLFGDGTNSSEVDGNHTYLNAGTYNVSLIAANSIGCSDTLTILNAVEVLNTPYSSFTANLQDISTPTDILFSNNSSNSDSCVLYYGDGTSISDCNWNQLLHQYPVEGTYTVTQILTNVSGCSDTTVLVLNLYGETIFYVPNAFTPDGNEKNNVFFVALPENQPINEFKLMIFNQWGEVLFKTTDPKEGWDGSYLGKLVKDGTYVWKLFLDNGKEGSHNYNGHVTVLR